jgi:hypothetical protein
VSLPDPHPGLVIRYAYLWKREYDEGREEGSKDVSGNSAASGLRGEGMQS